MILEHNLTSRHIEMIIESLRHVHSEYAHALIDDDDFNYHNQINKLLELFQGLRKGDTLRIL